MKWKWQIGDVVRNPLTGFAGVIVSGTDAMHGLTWVSVQPQTLRTDERKKTRVEVFDISQLEPVTTRSQPVGSAAP